MKLLYALQINGQRIAWKHVRDLVDKVHSTSVASHGLSLVPKLKQEHINLTSYSRMRVDLAAQVINVHKSLLLLTCGLFVI